MKVEVREEENGKQRRGEKKLEALFNQVDIPSYCVLLEEMQN